MKSEARQHQFAQFGQRPGANNSSLSHPAASCTEQLFVLTTPSRNNTEQKKKRAEARQSGQLRHRTSPIVRARHTDWSSPKPNASPNTPSVSVILWALRYYVLSSVGRYGSLWLLSCVSVQHLEILIVFPVFALLS